jgi:serine/threonine protein phosphatase 1
VVARLLDKVVGAVRGGATGARVPPQRRVYAIGDIHGRLDLLRRLHEQIARDIAAASPQRPVVVYLGDYIDRGPDSRGVIDLLREPSLPAEPVHLLGNHEAMLLEFLDQPESGLKWLYNGGAATLLSYGVELASEAYRGEQLTALQAKLRRALPGPHAAFLQGLARWHREGDYLFVHAGIRPGVPLAAQDDDDLIWIREDFLASGADHGAVVVHGHTIESKVQVKRNRIGIDTGAYATGTLTCLVLDGDRRSFLQT